MIKYIIFDIDGVLFDSCDLHYQALNQALSTCGFDEIPYDVHLNEYNGLPTNIKLERLNIPQKDRHGVWLAKQACTHIDKTEDNTMRETLSQLKERGYRLGCATNCIRDTMIRILTSLDIIDLLEIRVCNEDVTHPKPSPEIYETCMNRFNALPEETLIVEDSDIGIQAATNSRSHVVRVSSPEDVTVGKIVNYIQQQTNSVNIVIPMAGNGSRFKEAGYTIPKPWIPIHDIPMIIHVIRSLDHIGTYHFIVPSSVSKNDLHTIERECYDCRFIVTDVTTEGAACSVLLAKEWMNRDATLCIVNSDQLLTHPMDRILNKLQGNDAVISTFHATESKWSFVECKDDIVTRVAEKQPISDIATTGLYVWKRGSDFVRYAEQMIRKNIRCFNEFYVCPVFNEAIADGKRIVIDECDEFHGVGTPEDLHRFLIQSMDL